MEKLINLFIIGLRVASIIMTLSLVADLEKLYNYHKKVHYKVLNDTDKYPEKTYSWYIVVLWILSIAAWFVKL